MFVAERILSGKLFQFLGHLTRGVQLQCSLLVHPVHLWCGAYLLSPLHSPRSTPSTIRYEENGTAS